jgi:Ca2+-binding RTX toxin-like protein
VAVDLSAGVATGEGNDTILTPRFSGGIIGSAFDDTLVGSPVHDTIQAAGGDDRIRGKSGDDVREPDRVGPRTMQTYDRSTAPGDDIVRGNNGDDYVLSVRGRDRVFGDDGKDLLFGGGSGSDLGGEGGKDYIDADPGVNVHGGSGVDRIIAVLGPRKAREIDGGAGRDDILLKAPKSSVKPGSHVVVDVPREKLSVSGRKRLVWQGVESLYFDGSRGRLTYYGCGRVDGLRANSSMRISAYGRGGRDVLLGGKFTDLLNGGPGRDTVVGGGRTRPLSPRREGAPVRVTSLKRDRRRPVRTTFDP